MTNYAKSNNNDTQITSAGDPDLIGRLQSTNPTVPPVDGITGSDLASVALCRLSSHLSTRDISVLGVMLIQEAVKLGDIKAAASAYATLAAANKKPTGSQGGQPDNRSQVQRALQRSMQSRANRQVVDVYPDQPPGLEPDKPDA